MQWLPQPVVEWENSLKFMEFANYVKTKLVVNDPAERALGLIKPIIKKFKKEKNLQSAMIVTKKARAAWPAKKNCSMNKTELNKIKLFSHSTTGCASHCKSSAPSPIR